MNSQLSFDPVWFCLQLLRNIVHNFQLRIATQASNSAQAQVTCAFATRGFLTLPFSVKGRRLTTMILHENFSQLPLIYSRSTRRRKFIVESSIKLNYGKHCSSLASMFITLLAYNNKHRKFAQREVSNFVNSKFILLTPLQSRERRGEEAQNGVKLHCWMHSNQILEPRNTHEEVLVLFHAATCDMWVQRDLTCCTQHKY